MTTFDWQKVREEAIARFGETPGSQLEQDLIHRFHENPRAIVAAIERVAHELDRGEPIQSPWALVRHRTTEQPGQHLVVEDLKTRDRKVRQAEQWIRNAGLYLDREAELLSELFDEGKPLHPYQDQGLETRLSELWHEQRPRGQHAEQDAERRALDRIELRARLTAAKQAARPTTTEPESDPNWHEQPEPELAPERVGVR